VAEELLTVEKDRLAVRTDSAQMLSGHVPSAIEQSHSYPHSANDLIGAFHFLLSEGGSSPHIPQPNIMCANSIPPP
jgi:hypothetical protein